MLDKRVVVISGANGGLGRVCSRVFAEAGAKVALLGRSEEELKQMAEEWGLASENYLAIGLDLSDSVANLEAARMILAKWGSLDVFINLVGGWSGGLSVLESPDEDFENMIQQHIRTPLAMIRAYLPAMQKGNWGRILAVSSPSAERPPGMNSPYAAGKAGMDAIMLSLAQELKGSGVTANLLQVIAVDVSHQRIKKPSEKNASWSTPEEISATLLHLSSDEAAMINGARIPVFGSF